MTSFCLCRGRFCLPIGNMEQNPYAAPSADLGASSPSTVAEDGPRDWTVGSALGVGWNAVKKNPIPLVGGFFLVAVLQWAVQAGLQYVMLGGSAQTQDPFAALGAMGVLLPVLMVFSIYLMIGEFRVALAAARGQDVEIPMFFSGYDRLLPGILLSIIVYAGTAIGFLLLIIPGIILSLGWSMCFVTLADTDMSTGDMLADSWEATKGQKGRIFLFGLASAGIILLGMLALYVGIFVALPVVMVGFAEVYMCVTGRRRGGDRSRAVNPQAA